MAVTMSSVLQADVLSGREVSFEELPTADHPSYLQQEAEKSTATEIYRTRPRQSELRSVVIPDLFVSFISQKPKPNPYYEVIKKESEAWMKQYKTSVISIIVRSD